MLGEYDCYGNKKKEVVENYYLNPVAYVKMIEGQRKNGCCGELKDRYIIFTYTAIANRTDKGVLFSGYDCAMSIIDLINEKKRIFNKPSIVLPTLFDPFKGFSNNLAILDINKDMLEIILILATIWDIREFKGSLPYLLGMISRYPFRYPSKRDILALNAIVGKDSKIVSGKAKHLRDRIILENKSLYCPKLLSFNAILGYINSIGELDTIYI